VGCQALWCSIFALWCSIFVLFCQGFRSYT